eukprot:TRINITY_DN10987_c0_g1_i2.p1 TRINITY_DN10987_c0_g1~~TRINITY_DN10987_c0_g1_i2.p1  ORF type:complete len:549 (+),score=182.61 TRINITY_DN10987_c0_g1_i2:88-1734(+)
MDAQFLSNPLDVVQSLFDKISPGDVRSNWGVCSHFEDVIGSHWREIPKLNFSFFEHLRDGTLVRYRGMVQDMFDTEYFLGAYEEINESTGEKRLVSGKYRDCIANKPGHRVDFGASSCVTLDRLPLLCVPVPGEAAWVEPIFGADHHPTAAGAGERSSTTPKRKEPTDDADSTPSAPGAPASRAKSQSAAPSGTAGIPAPATHFPLPDARNQLACLVKVYDDKQEGHFKLNDVVEFVGVLSVTPQLTSFAPDSMDTDQFPHNDFGRDGQSPPASVVPRLHCIAHRKLSSLDLVVPPHHKPGHTAAASSAVSAAEAASMRERLLVQLRRVLGGDALAAEYLMLGTLARVYKRHQLMCMGKFSLNIMNCPEDPHHNVFASVRHVLQSVVAKFVALPLSIDTLHQLRFTPRKDYDANTLASGLLQLSEGTLLAVDETVLQPGQVDQSAVSHLNALTHLIMWQKVEYDFQYHQIEFEVDIPVFVIPHGKSIFNCDCVLPLRPEAALPSFSAALLAPPNEFVDQIREYLAVSRSLDVSIDEATAKQMQDDLVR